MGRGGDWSAEGNLRAGRWATVALDAAYILYFIIASLVKQSPFATPRFTSRTKRIALVAHVIAGIVLIVSGSVVFVLYDTDLDPDGKIESALAVVMLVSVVPHSITGLILAPQCEGERLITFPLYILAISGNMANAAWMVFDELKIEHTLRLWGTINIFIYMRVILLTMVWWADEIDNNLLYTYGLGVGGSIALIATGQDPFLLGVFAGPTIFTAMYKRGRFTFLDRVDSVPGDQVQVNSSSSIQVAVVKEMESPGQASPGPGARKILSRNYWAKNSLESEQKKAGPKK